MDLMETLRRDHNMNSHRERVWSLPLHPRASVVPARTAQAKQQREQSSKRIPPSPLCNYLFCTVLRCYIPSAQTLLLVKAMLLAIKLKPFAFSDMTITSASFGMRLTDLICASHLINSPRHLIFNLAVLWLLCSFPSPFIPLLQALQCTSSPQRQDDQDICQPWK